MATAKKASSKAGGVRFAEDSASSAAAAAAHSHVHFEEKLHDSVVMVIPESDGNFLVKVGFLKTQHKYEIIFTLPEVPELGKEVCPAPVPNPYLQIKDITAAPDGLDYASWSDSFRIEYQGLRFSRRDCSILFLSFVTTPSPGCIVKCPALYLSRPCFFTKGLTVTCEYMAHQEGVLCEEMVIVSETKEDVTLKVKVHARVMDRHHGTPMLLEGVRCIGAELEYDSEQSDWQGFD